MLRTTALAALLALACVPATAAAAPADGAVTGGGIVTSANVPFVPFHLTVNARGGEAPSGRVTVHSADVDFVGEVSCYVQDGDTVYIAGPIVKSHDLATGNGFYALSIQDNGDEDLVSFNAVEGVELPCGATGAPSAPLASGNLTVR